MFFERMEMFCQQEVAMLHHGISIRLTDKRL